MTILARTLQRVLVEKAHDSHLDIFPRGFPAALEFPAFQLEIQIVTHVARHNYVREAELLRETDVFEQQWILIANLR